MSKKRSPASGFSSRAKTAPRQGRQQLVLIFAGVTPRHLQAGLRAKARQRRGLEVGNPNAVV